MCRSLAPVVLAAAVLVAPAFAHAAEGDDEDTVRPRVTVTPRVGLGFPGEATARKVSKTKVGVGFVMHHDVMIALGNWFEIGPYLHYSLRGITERGDTNTDGQRNHLMSLGVTPKAKIRTSKRSRLRIGCLLGFNYTKQNFESDVGKGDIIGKGFNVAPSVEWSHDVARRVAINVAFSMITQVAGKADIGGLGALVEGGSKQKMTFPPLAFLALGVDFGLGSR